MSEGGSNMRQVITVVVESMDPIGYLEKFVREWPSARIIELENAKCPEENVEWRESRGS